MHIITNKNTKDAQQPIHMSTQTRHSTQ